jgi:hypothetical protein
MCDKPLITDAPICPYCDIKTTKMDVPPLAKFEAPYLYVCFNDDCRYLVSGWKRMEEKYGSKTSYRHYVDPFTRSKGPIPVWSNDALKDCIVTEE